jgi:hypothetical protein
MIVMNLDSLFYGPGRLTKSRGSMATAAFVLAGLLVVWSAYIHFRLWQTEGYRHIPTIGPLFIIQSIAGVVIGVLIVAVRRLWVAVVGAGFAISTMVGFVVSLEVGLFGFQDNWSAPFAQQAFFIELAATVALFVAGALCFTKPVCTGPTGSDQPGLPLSA